MLRKQKVWIRLLAIYVGAVWVIIGVLVIIWIWTLAAGSVRFGNIVVSGPLALLMAAILQVTILPFRIAILEVIRRSERDVFAFLPPHFAYALALALDIGFAGLTVWYVAHNPQDLTTLAIVWAFVTPGLLFVGKNLLTGILGAIGGAVGKRVVDEVTRPDDKNTNDKNTNDKTTAQN